MSEAIQLAAGFLPAGEYAIVEALGHRTLVGRVSEIERFGTKMLQVEPIFGDVMLGPILLGGGSIYQFTPCTAEVAYSILAAAQAIEARRAATTGAVHESAVRQDAPKP